MQRIEALEQDLLQHKQRVRTQLESMQASITQWHVASHDVHDLPKYYNTGRRYTLYR